MICPPITQLRSINSIQRATTSDLLDIKCTQKSRHLRTISRASHEMRKSKMINVLRERALIHTKQAPIWAWHQRNHHTRQEITSQYRRSLYHHPSLSIPHQNRIHKPRTPQQNSTSWQLSHDAAREHYQPQGEEEGKLHAVLLVSLTHFLHSA